MEDSNQHYITKAYLDKFVHPSSGQNILYPYRKGGRPCKARGTKKLGSAINFYRQHVNGELTDRLDEARKKSETLLFGSGKKSSSTLVNCVFDEDFVPSSESEYLELAAAAAFLFCGSPIQIHNTAMYSLLLIQMDAFNRMNTQKAKEHYRELYGDQAEEMLEKHRQELLTGKLFVDVGQENWKQLGFTSYQYEKEVIELLLKMNLSMVDCHYKSFFLTSDNPVVRIYPSQHGKLDDEVWFPISHKRAVLWHRRKDIGLRTGLGHCETRTRNRLSLKWCYKFIYSPLPDDWIETAASEEKFDPLFGYYGSLEKVIERARPAVNQRGEQVNDIVDLVEAVRASNREDVLGI